MKKIISLLVSLLFCVNTYGGEIHISPPMSGFIPAQYPKNVSKMTNEQFYHWAVKRNKQAEADWYKQANDQFYTTNGNITKASTEGNNAGGSVTYGGMRINPGQSYRDATMETFNTQHRFANPDYVAPNPLIIINPFVKPK
jgi:hypothetical protein